MLSAAHRLRRSADFGRTVREGVRAGRPTLVVHYLADPTNSAPTTVGFVVSKGIGNAVVRNKVKRRLRGLIAEYLPLIPHGSYVVVRALPSAANAEYARLDADLLGALTKVQRMTRSASPQRHV